jgi:cephalosporin hydroxylase
MLRQPATACLALLLVLSYGFSGSESHAAEPEAQQTPVEPVAGNRTDSPRVSKRDIADFERAMGKDHGRTPEEMQAIMKNLRAAPSMKNKFLGVSTLQSPSDAWIVMEILQEVKPDLIVEAGTFRGGSALLWAIILEHINPEGRVITIDIQDQRDRRATQMPITKRKIDFLLGSSTDPKVVAEVHRRAKGKRVLVLLDSLHSKAHVARELEAYAPLVERGSYIIVQDTPVGPMGAIEEFIANTDKFVIDRSRERYPDTHSIKGYLKRVRD